MLHIGILAALVSASAVGQERGKDLERGTDLGREQILDRIAVIVGTQVITESQVITDLRVEAFIDQKPVDLSGKAKLEAAGRLVDQMLMLQEADTSHLALPTLEAAQELVNRLRADYPMPGSFQAALDRYKITEHDVAVHMLIGLQTLTFTELRFRPGIQISDADLQKAYEELVPADQRTQPGGSLEDNRRQLEDLLINRRVIQSLDEWLADARTDLSIRYRRPVFR